MIMAVVERRKNGCSARKIIWDTNSLERSSYTNSSAAMTGWRENRRSGSSEEGNRTCVIQLSVCSNDYLFSNLIDLPIFKINCITRLCSATTFKLQGDVMVMLFAETFGESFENGYVHKTGNLEVWRKYSSRYKEMKSWGGRVSKSAVDDEVARELNKRPCKRLAGQ